LEFEGTRERRKEREQEEMKEERNEGRQEGRKERRRQEAGQRYHLPYPITSSSPLLSTSLLLLSPHPRATRCNYKT
jgi:hypothetical protein